MCANHSVIPVAMLVENIRYLSYFLSAATYGSHCWALPIQDDCSWVASASSCWTWLNGTTAGNVSCCWNCWTVKKEYLR